MPPTCRPTRLLTSPPEPSASPKSWTTTTIPMKTPAASPKPPASRFVTSRPFPARATAYDRWTCTCLAPSRLKPTGISPSRPDLFPFEIFGPGEHSFPSAYASRFKTLIAETNTLMPALVEEFRAHGGTINVQSFANKEQLQAFDAPIVVNATGLGAKALFGDDELVPMSPVRNAARRARTGVRRRQGPQHRQGSLARPRHSCRRLPA